MYGMVDKYWHINWYVNNMYTLVDIHIQTYVYVYFYFWTKQKQEGYLYMLNSIYMCYLGIFILEDTIDTDRVGISIKRAIPHIIILSQRH